MLEKGERRGDTAKCADVEVREETTEGFYLELRNGWKRNLEVFSGPVWSGVE
jgi:hypothetical protein